MKVDLAPDEVELLTAGLREWGGPATATHELAVALGFSGIEDMYGQCRRMAVAIAADAELSIRDWSRALAAVELAFVSDIWGSGSDWAITQGTDDAETIKTLRRLQRKLMKSGALARPTDPN